MKASLQKELGCSVAEVGYQDLWQRAAIGVAAATSTETGAQRVLDRIVAIIELVLIRIVQRRRRHVRTLAIVRVEVVLLDAGEVLTLPDVDLVRSALAPLGVQPDDETVDRAHDVAVRGYDGRAVVG